MQRDSKGRFVKKAQFGNNLNYELEFKHNDSPLLETIIPIIEPSTSIQTITQTPNYFGSEISNLNTRKRYKIKSGANDAFNQYLLTNPNANPTDWLFNQGKDYLEEVSAGINVSNNDSQNNTTFSLNKEKLANYLEYAKGAIGLGVNNKIAKRAIDAEKPFLQTTSESNRSVYGDYDALQQGEKSAAELRKMASKPLTSDGSLQQDARLKAEIEAQKSIAQGLEADNQRIRQTQEIAWQQEKENQLQRNAVANANRQAMMMSEKNKSNILNMRDSANFSQVINPFLSAKEQRLRDEVTKQERYQDELDKAYVSQDIWNNMDESNLTDEQKTMRTIYLSQGSNGLNTYFIDHPEARGAWAVLNQEVEKQTLQRLAQLKGITINSLETNNSITPWQRTFGENILSNKKGGTIYKARLTKRTKDNDRTAKSIDSSKKIAARFLEKALDSLYTYKDIELIAKRKYQAGGGLPFVGITPVFSSSETGVPRETKEEKTTKKESGDLTSKDILELLKNLEGLPVDIDAIQYYLSNFSVEDDLDPLGLASSSNIASRYIGLISKIKEAQFHRNEYSVAYNHLVQTGGLDEYAVTQDGFLIGRNAEGDYKHFTAEDVAKNKAYDQGYQILTNSNLLYIRQNDPSANFNRGILTVAKNGIGMTEINQLINSSISNLGTTENSQQGYVDTKHGQLIQGLQDFVKAMQQSNGSFDLSVQDLYKYKYLTKSQAEQAQKALAYVYQTLPKSAKVILKSKSDGTDEGAISLVGSLIASKTNSYESFDVDSVKDIEDLNKGKKSGSDKDDSSIKLNQAQLLQQGFGELQTLVIQDGTSSGLKVNVSAMPVVEKEGEGIGSATLEDVTRTQYAGMLDFTNASMGEKIIPFEGRQFIAIDGNRLYSMDLPIDQEELIKGNIVPDLDLIDKFNEISQEISAKKITDINQINQIFQDSGLPIYMNQDGSVKSTFYRKFAVLNGTMLDNAFGKSFVPSRYFKEIHDEDAINNTLSILNKNRGDKDKIDFDERGFFNWRDSSGNYDALYEGTIFIPLSTNIISGFGGSGYDLTPEQAKDLYEKQQQKDRVQQTYVKPAELR